MCVPLGEPKLFATSPLLPPVDGGQDRTPQIWPVLGEKRLSLEAPLVGLGCEERPGVAHCGQLSQTLLRGMRVWLTVPGGNGGPQRKPGANSLRGWATPGCPSPARDGPAANPEDLMDA